MLGLALGSALVMAALGIRGVHAGDPKKPEYVSTAVMKRLLSGPLPGVDGKHITIIQATVPPGWVGGRHYHTGPVYVYVLEGSFTVEEQGKPRQTFRAGDLYSEPLHTPMQAFNVSASEPASILLVQVHARDEPLMYKAD
jgi:quercetin dioxygenase-like cupin family protein